MLEERETESSKERSSEMYRKLAVPLDGSALAECVLPHVKAIARGCSIREVVLLRAIEPLPVEDSVDWNHSAAQKGTTKVAEEYLAKIQADLIKEGLTVRSEVLLGKAGEAISEFVERNDVDLVAIATHGRSGITRWAFGSVADKLVRSSSVPVLVVRPEYPQSGT
jgi:nucleotide-binding universal stress UspA family protein